MRWMAGAVLRDGGGGGDDDAHFYARTLLWQNFCLAQHCTRAPISNRSPLSVASLAATNGPQQRHCLGERGGRNVGECCQDTHRASSRPTPLRPTPPISIAVDLQTDRHPLYSHRCKSQGRPSKHRPLHPSSKRRAGLKSADSPSPGMTTTTGAAAAMAAGRAAAGIPCAGQQQGQRSQQRRKRRRIGGGGGAGAERPPMIAPCLLAVVLVCGTLSRFAEAVQFQVGGSGISGSSSRRAATTPPPPVGARCVLVVWV